MHDEMNMIHLDLKMANVMGKVVNGIPHYVLLDFGYSRDLTKDGVEEEIRIPGKAYGTFPYKPPEVIFENIHGKKSDIYCIGAIALFLSLGETPFYDNDGEKDIYAHRKFLRGRYELTHHPNTSNELKNFIKKCMNLDRHKRPTARELLKHEFILNKPIDNISSEVEDDSGYTSSSEMESDSHTASTVDL